MSDLMLFGVLQMPYEMAMNDELSRVQFYQRVQEAATMLRQQQAEIEALKGEVAQLKHINKNWKISENILLLELEKLQEQLEECTCQGGHSQAYLIAKGRSQEK